MTIELPSDTQDSGEVAAPAHNGCGSSGNCRSGYDSTSRGLRGGSPPRSMIRDRWLRLMSGSRQVPPASNCKPANSNEVWRSGRDSNSRTGYARYGISSADSGNGLILRVPGSSTSTRLELDFAWSSTPLQRNPVFGNAVASGQEMPRPLARATGPMCFPLFARGMATYGSAGAGRGGKAATVREL